MKDFLKKFWLCLLIVAGIAAPVYVKINYNQLLIDETERITIEKSGIEDDVKYQEYIQLKEEGKLDENSLVVDDRLMDFKLDEKQTKTNPIVVGDIPVSFVTSNIVDIKYYKDAMHTKPLENESYHNYGDKVYCSAPTYKNSFEKTHTFKYLELSVDGQVIDTIYLDGNDTHFTIPDVKELVVTPRSELNSISFTFDDYFIDETGNTITLPGTFVVDGENYDRNDSLMDQLPGKHEIKYIYDPNVYYVNYDNDDNVNVHSSKLLDNGYQEASFKSDSYYRDETIRIRLSKYITLFFNDSYKKGISSIYLNGEQIELNDNQIDHIKCKDKMIIETNKDYVLISNSLQYTQESLPDGKLRYTVSLPKETNDLKFELGVAKAEKTGNFERRNVNNGDIVVSYAETNGNAELTEKTIISDNEKVKVTITPHENYYISGKNVNNNVFEEVMEYQKYKSSIDSIIEEHQIIKYVTLILDSNDKFGNVTYFIDGNECSGKMSDLKVGQKLKIKYVLTDENYKIQHESPDWWFTPKDLALDLIGSKEASLEMKITEDMSGQTITRDKYITITRKGE